MNDKNIAMENMVSEAEILEWASTHYWDSAEKENATIVRHIALWLLEKRKQIETIRKCGTCRYFIKHPDTCMKGWGMIKHIIHGLIGSDSTQSMCELDWHNCPDWEQNYEKPQFSQCLTCANWQDVIHHQIDQCELIDECKIFRDGIPSKFRLKRKEKRRVWSCLNCGKDIYFLRPTFVHVDSEKFQCSNRIVDYYNVAIPHPDKPMRTE